MAFDAVGKQDPIVSADKHFTSPPTIPPTRSTTNAQNDAPVLPWRRGIFTWLEGVSDHSPTEQAPPDRPTVTASSTGDVKPRPSCHPSATSAQDHASHLSTGENSSASDFAPAASSVGYSSRSSGMRSSYSGKQVNREDLQTCNPPVYFTSFLEAFRDKPAARQAEDLNAVLQTSSRIMAVIPKDLQVRNVIPFPYSDSGLTFRRGTHQFVSRKQSDSAAATRDVRRRDPLFARRHLSHVGYHSRDLARSYTSSQPQLVGSRLELVGHRSSPQTRH